MVYRDPNWQVMRAPPAIDADGVVVDFGTVPEGKSLTRQEFVEECDINNLMKQYANGGMLPPADRPPQYIDCIGVPDYQAALDIVREAGEAFASLPAAARRQFDNDPVQFVQFASDPDNREQLEKWGLTAPPVVPEPPMRVEVVAPPVPPGDAPKAP